MARHPHVPGRGGRAARAVRRLIVALLLLGVLAPSALAQRSDPTPVRRSLGPHPGRVRAEVGLESAVDRVVETWPSASAAVARHLGMEEPAPVEVVLLSGPTFRYWSQGTVPEWGVGVARWPGGPITLDIEGVARSRKTLEEILRHELSHVYLGQRLAHAPPPRWFVEGVAQAQSGEWRFLDTLALVRAASTGQLPPLQRLGVAFPRPDGGADLAYKLSLQAVLELDEQLASTGGWRGLVDAAARRGSFPEAFREQTGLGMDDWAREFHARLKGRYRWASVLTQPTTLFGLMALLFLVGATRTLIRRRRRLAEMEEEEIDSLGPPAP